MKANHRLLISILFCLLAGFVGCAPISRELRQTAEPLPWPRFLRTRTLSREELHSSLEWMPMEVRFDSLSALRRKVNRDRA